MVEEDLGAATIVYEAPDEETVEETFENEHVAYFQDHWIVKTGGEEGGPDTVRRIPASRVYYVERDVEAFEEEVSSVVDDVQSVADGVGSEVRTVKSRLESVADELQSGLSRRRKREPPATDDDVYRIEVETGDAVGTGSDDAGGTTESGSGEGEDDGGST